MPMGAELVPGEDVVEPRRIEVREFCQINKSRAVFWASYCEGDCRKVFGAHHPHPVMIPLDHHCRIDRFAFEAGRRAQELHGKSMNKQALFLEFMKSKFVQSVENRFKGNQEHAWPWVHKHEDIHIACRQWLAMKTGGSGSTDGVLLQYSLAEELFESVADGLHDFLMISS